MVAYHYPPEGGSSGVLRTLKFSKYLTRHGWAPHVLTLRESAYGVRDDRLMGEVPAEVVVHRTLGFDTARHFAIRGRYPGILTMPDRFATWLPFAVARGLRVVRRAPIRCLYSTSPQPTAHLIALALKAVTGRPWVADFRDPWVEDVPEVGRSALGHRVERRLEAAVVRRADRLLTTTPRLRDDFLKRYPDLDPAKARVVYNGYDEADVPPAALPRERGERLELLHAGLVTPSYRDPAPLFRAVAALIARERLDRARIRVVFMGGSRYLESERFRALVREHGLGDVVEVAPRVSHAEAMVRMLRADGLLLLQASDDTRALIPAKTFEYLRAGRPILAVLADGATTDLLAGMPACHVAEPGDAPGLEAALLRLYDAWRGSPGPISVTRPVARFERARLTGELAAILQELCPGTAERPAAEQTGA
jgi:glycosyltransferase involved in cell wall biosynthesis